MCVIIITITITIIITPSVYQQREARSAFGIIVFNKGKKSLVERRVFLKSEKKRKEIRKRKEKNIRFWSNKMRKIPKVIKRKKALKRSDPETAQALSVDEEEEIEVLNQRCQDEAPEPGTQFKGYPLTQCITISRLHFFLW